MEKSKKGIIFYRTKYNTYYYINFKGEHIIKDLNKIEIQSLKFI